MNHQQAMKEVSEDLEKNLENLSAAWKVVMSPSETQSNKIRAIFLIKSYLASQNTLLNLTNELMQLDAQMGSVLG